MLNMLKYFIICKTELHLHLTKYLRYQFSSTLLHTFVSVSWSVRVQGYLVLCMQVRINLFSKLKQ